MIAAGNVTAKSEQLVVIVTWTRKRPVRTNSLLPQHPLNILPNSGVHRLFEEQGQKEGHFSTHFGSQEGTLVCVFAPKRAVYYVLTSQGGSLVCFANQEGTLACFFGSQEGTLAHVLVPRRAL